MTVPLVTDTTSTLRFVSRSSQDLVDLTRPSPFRRWLQAETSLSERDRVFDPDCNSARVSDSRKSINRENNLCSTYFPLISIYRCNLLIQSSKTSTNISAHMALPCLAKAHELDIRLIFFPRVGRQSISLSFGGCTAP
jgi:hypothetical protein